MTPRILFGVLFASLALNAYLFFAKGGARVAPDRDEASSNLDGRQAASPTKEAGRRTPVVAGSETCESRLADIESRLGKPQESLVDRLGLRPRFKKAPPTKTPPEVERHLARIFATSGLEDVKYRVECRGRICFLELVSPPDFDDNDWMEPLQRDRAFRAHVDGLSFGEDGPADPTPVVGVDRSDIDRSFVYFNLAERSRESSNELLERLLDEFTSSQAVSLCRGSQSASGSVDVMLVLSAEDKEIVVHTGGTLAGHPVGECIAGRLRELAKQVTLPDDPVTAWQAARINVP